MRNSVVGLFVSSDISYSMIRIQGKHAMHGACTLLQSSLLPLIAYLHVQSLTSLLKGFKGSLELNENDFRQVYIFLNFESRAQ